MRRQLSLLGAGVFCFIVMSTTAHAKTVSEWKLAKNKDGLKVYTKKEEGSSLLQYKVDVTFECEVAEVVNVLLDFDNYTSWVYTCVASNILEKIDDKNYIYYNEFSAPWPVSNRDLIVKFTIESYSDNGAELTLVGTSKYMEQVAGLVRMPEYKASWVLIKDADGNTHGIHEGFMNPGGSLPAWLVNSTIVDGPFDSFSALKEMVDGD